MSRLCVNRDQNLMSDLYVGKQIIVRKNWGWLCQGALYPAELLFKP